MSRDWQGLEARLRSLGAAADVAVCDSAEASDALAARQNGRVLHDAGTRAEGLLVEVVAQRLRWVHALKAGGGWRMACV